MILNQTFNKTKIFIKNITGKVFCIDDIVYSTVKAVHRTLNDIPDKQIDEHIVPAVLSIDLLKQLDIKDTGIKVTNIVKTIKVRRKKFFHTAEHYGYLIAGDVLVTLGSTEADDEIIITAVVAAVVAATGSMSGPAGSIAAKLVTDKTLRPILKGVFKCLNKHQVKIGNNFKQKANS
jgi:hypothetical protein